MSGVAVRPATPGDAPAIAGVSVRGWHHAYADFLDPAAIAGRDVEQQAPRWRALLAEPRRRTWVAQAEERIVAYATIAPSADPDATRAVGMLDGLYVDPGAQGAGLGTRLLALAVDALRADGYTCATLWTFAANEQGRAFYERAGWEVDPRGAGHEGENWLAPSVRYRLTLGPADA